VPAPEAAPAATVSAVSAVTAPAVTVAAPAAATPPATEVQSWYDAGLRLEPGVVAAVFEEPVTEWPSIGGKTGYHRMNGERRKPDAALNNMA